MDILERDAVLALLNDAPVDVDFSLFTDSDQKLFIRSYYDTERSLPTLDLFCLRFNLVDEKVKGPWSYYRKELQDRKFVKEALPILKEFNLHYESEPYRATIELRDGLVKLSTPTTSVVPVSVVKDRSRFERFRSDKGGRILTGIKPLDDVSGGLSCKDEFMIISARLGIGKSWIAHSMAHSMANDGHIVGIYSGEMSEDEVGARFDSFTSHISNFSLTRGNDIDLTEHNEALDKIKGDLLVLTPTQLQHNARPSDLRRFVKDYNLDVLFIDQLSLMEPDGMRGGADYERKALLSYQLKSLQQELRIPIIAVSQLNRGATQQEADASNIAGSDRIGQDATLIIALSRRDTTLKIKVLKARSFKVLDEPWEFMWDIDKGIIEPKLSAIDALTAKIAQAKLKEAEAKENPQPVEEEEIW